MSKLNKAQKQAIIKQFKAADANHDGSISQKELGDIFASIDPSWTSASKLAMMFDAVDKDDDGRIDVREFVEWIFGRNVQVRQLQEQMSYDVLRLTNLGAYSYDDLLKCMSQFGTVKFMHQVANRTVESIVVFSSQQQAVAAFRAFFENPDDADAALAKAEEQRETSDWRLGGCLLNTQKLCYEGGSSGSVYLTESASYKKGDVIVPSNFGKNLERAVFDMGSRIQANAGWLKRAKGMDGKPVTLKYAANMLRNLSDAIDDDFFLDDQDEALDRWEKSMRIIAKGQIDAMNADFINAALGELLSFCQNSGVKGAAPVFQHQDRHSMPIF